MEKRKWLTWFTNSLPWSEISTLVHPYLQKTYTTTMVIQTASKKAKQVIKKKVTQEFGRLNIAHKNFPREAKVADCRFIQYNRANAELTDENKQ